VVVACAFASAIRTEDAVKTRHRGAPGADAVWSLGSQRSTRIRLE
jgi:hypothetical protein